MELAPLKIRMHLVPFFFTESKGNAIIMGNRKVKAVVFSPFVSSMGKLIKLFLEQVQAPMDFESLNLVLEITPNDPDKYKGAVYKKNKAGNCLLRLPEHINNDINDIFEDMFRMAFVNYIDGCVDNNTDSVIVYAIDKWIEKYDLLEVGYCNDTLRRLYYREKEKGCLSRFQNKKSNTILNT
nr:hypothetical protein [uncultured Flavobacterium sp.]